MSLPAPIPVTGTTPVTLLPAVSARTIATIWNDGPHAIYLKFDASADALTPANGLPLARGQSAKIDVVNAVTACCAVADMASVRVQDESTP